MLNGVNDYVGVGRNPSWPRVAVFRDESATVAAVESIDEGGIGSRVVELGSVEDDAFGETEVLRSAFANDHEGDSERVVICQVEAGPTPRDAVTDAGRFGVELVAAGRTVCGVLGSDGETERNSFSGLG